MIHLMFEIFCLSFATMVGIVLGIFSIIGIVFMIEKIFDRIGR